MFNNVELLRIVRESLMSTKLSGNLATDEQVLSAEAIIIVHTTPTSLGIDSKAVVIGGATESLHCCVSKADEAPLCSRWHSCLHCLPAGRR